MSQQLNERQDSDIADALLALIGIMKTLRHPEKGCPWDLAQTHESIVPYTIEEAYEVAEAVAKGNPDDIRDELGDLLLQIVFQSQIASEGGRFDISDVANSINQKMINRHPHIFSNNQADNPTAVREQWEDIKSRERARKGETGFLDGIASTLPAVMQALKLQNRAARVGFDWPDVHSILEKLREETKELETEINAPHQDRMALEDECGDILFVAVNLVRKLDIDPEQALASTNRKFRKRFSHVEEMASRSQKTLNECSLDEMEYWWQDAKTLS
jgi:MazG family protein